MKIAAPLLTPRPLVNKGGPDKPLESVADLWIAGSGAVLGGSLGGLAGSALGREYGSRVVTEALPQAWKLVQHGWISTGTALRLYQSAMHPATQAQVGALGVGLVGAALGAALAMSFIEARHP